MLLLELFDEVKKENKQEDKNDKEKNQNKVRNGGQKTSKEVEVQKPKGGNDTNKGKGVLITRWDPKPKGDLVNSSNQFQALEQQDDQ